MTKRLLLLLISCLCATTAWAQTSTSDAWINEIHYDNSGADQDEYVEVVANSNFVAASYTLTLYNGSNGTSYSTATLDGCTATATGNGWTVYGCLMSAFSGSSIQNGGPDGVALDYSGTLIQFLSYEGAFMASGGPADGMMSTDIGVSETSSTPAGESLQLQGTGDSYDDFAWTEPAANSYDAVNTSQTLNPPPGGTTDTRVAFEAPASVTEAEGDAGTQQVDVNLQIQNESATTDTDVTVTVGGTAELGTDYTITNYTPDGSDQFTVTFPAGSSADQTITVEINGDETVESDENVTFTISQVAGGESAAAGSPDTYSIEISNDDFDTSLPFAEDFEEAGTAEFGTFTMQSLASSADWAPETDAGNGALSTDGFVSINAFGADEAADDWLVSPTFDLSGESSASASFYAERSFSDDGNNNLTFYVTNGFTGDVTTTTWSSVTVPDPGEGTGFNEASFDLTDIDGTDFTGAGNDEVVMAIQYTSTGTGGGTSAGYAVDQFAVTAGAPQTTVAFENETLSLDEGDSGTTTQTVGIVASNPAAGSATTATIEVSGSATEGVDYTLNDYTLDGSNQFTVTFPAGATAPQQAISIDVIGDTDDESSETVIFDIVSVGGGESAMEGTPGTSTVTINNDDAPPAPVAINEFLADPATDDGGTPEVEGDANGDGTRDSSEDEFVEILNTGGGTFDLSGYTLSDGFGLRHTFPPGTMLDSGQAVVVFGGGEPAETLNGIIQTASEGQLGLNNGGDVITLSDDGGAEVTSVEYGGGTGLDGGQDQSLAREPDGSGNFVLHTTITSNPVAFSPGQDNTDDTPLPVELDGFTATAAGAGVQLRWRTLSETNNAGFEVQRRVDGTFVEEAYVAGAGTTTEARSYEHAVAGLEAGTHVFRLRQVDFDGTASYSPQVEVTVAMARAYVIEAPAPNPTTGRATLGVTVQRAQDIQVELFDALGRRVSTVFSGRVGASERVPVTVEGSALPSGMYFYRVTGETFNTTGRLVVVQ